MIRNVVVGKLDDGVALDDITPALDAILALDPPGLVEVHVGTDLRLRAGGFDFAITNDFEDADAYRAYDLDEEHNRIRQEMFAPLCQQIVRIQFTL